MRIFKKKRRIDAYSDAISPQEYVDQQIVSINVRINLLVEAVEILNVLNGKEHLFIYPETIDFDKKEDSWIDDKEARELARKNNYYFVKTFKEHGELWVKEGEMQ